MKATRAKIVTIHRVDTLSIAWAWAIVAAVLAAAYCLVSLLSLSLSGKPGVGLAMIVITVPLSFAASWVAGILACTVLNWILRSHPVSVLTSEKPRPVLETSIRQPKLFDPVSSDFEEENGIPQEDSPGKTCPECGLSLARELTTCPGCGKKM